MLGTMKYRSVNMLLSSAPVLGLLNKKVERYGTIEKLFVDESGYHATVGLLGRGASLSIAVGRIELSDDCSRVVLRQMQGSEIWLQHLLEDLVDGREFELPPAAASALKPFRSLLP